MKHENRTIQLSPQETLHGFLYMAFELILLPVILTQLNPRLPRPMAEADLNFIYFAINYLVIFRIFRRLLYVSSTRIWPHKLRFLLTVVLGLGAYALCSLGFQWAITAFFPGFRNANDQNIALLLYGNFPLICIGTVFLVPMVEECLFRGLIFGSLYEKSRIAAYVVSMTAFSVIHIMGYLGTAPAADLLAAFLQYLPAGLILALSYAAAGTLFAPILIHSIINLSGILFMFTR